MNTLMQGCSSIFPVPEWFLNNFSRVSMKEVTDRIRVSYWGLYCGVVEIKGLSVKALKTQKDNLCKVIVVDINENRLGRQDFCIWDRYLN